MIILYLARDYGSEITGASTVMKRNLKALKSIVGSDNVYSYILPRSNKKDIAVSLLTLNGYGITKKQDRDIVKLAKKIKPDFVFIESSSYGSTTKLLSKNGFITISFAHNVDSLLAKQEIKSRNPFIAIPKLISTFFNERKTLRFAKTLICLNDRDAQKFDCLFGRKGDIILPITFPLKAINKDISKELVANPYMLFVGSDFFPNVEGINWFISNVAPYIKYEIHVVGSCCKNLKLSEMKLPSNVKLLGYVDDLDKEYNRASGVIAPIFKGSGMKTKTIEALSYGKSIFGTDEAFTGIETDYPRIGGRCNSAPEFIESINNYSGEQFNDNSICLFLSRYSDDSFIAKLKEFLDAH